MGPSETSTTKAALSKRRSDVSCLITNSRAMGGHEKARVCSEEAGDGQDGVRKRWVDNGSSSVRTNCVIPDNGLVPSSRARRLGEGESGWLEGMASSSAWSGRCPPPRAGEGSTAARGQ